MFCLTLFRAVIQSPPSSAYSSDLKETEGLGQEFADYAGCDKDAVVECLRNKSQSEIMQLTWSRRTFALPVR